MLYKKVYEKIENNKKIRDKGDVLGISYPFARFSKFIPGIIRKLYVIVTGSTKAAKTKLTDFLYVYHPVRWLLANPNKGVDYKCLYFSLELDTETKILDAICNYLYVTYGISISSLDLTSELEKGLSDDMLKKVGEAEEFVNQITDKVEFIDFVKSPNHIMRYIEQFAHDIGYYEDIYGKKLDSKKIERGDINEIKRIHKYCQNDPNLIVTIVIDHVGNVKNDGRDSDKQTIQKISDYFRDTVRNRWFFHAVMVQQQANSQQNLEHIKFGRVRPTGEGLEKNKDTQQDCDMMLGIMSPYALQIDKWNGIDIKNTNPNSLGDNYRELSIPINRKGPRPTINLYFDGAASHFEELPKVMMPADYTKYKKKSIK